MDEAKARSRDEDEETMSRWSINGRLGGSGGYYMDYWRCRVVSCVESRHGVK